jgi:hypothetical protein
VCSVARWVSPTPSDRRGCSIPLCAFRRCLRRCFWLIFLSLSTGRSKELPGSESDWQPWDRPLSLRCSAYLLVALFYPLADFPLHTDLPTTSSFLSFSASHSPCLLSISPQFPAFDQIVNECVLSPPSVFCASVDRFFSPLQSVSPFSASALYRLSSFPSIAPNTDTAPVECTMQAL